MTNDPKAMGVFLGLTHDVDRAGLARAVLEGVAFALADGQEALLKAGAEIDAISVDGGGARSRYWGASRHRCWGGPSVTTPAVRWVRTLARRGSHDSP